MIIRELERSWSAQNRGLSAFVGAGCWQDIGLERSTQGSQWEKKNLGSASAPSFVVWAHEPFFRPDRNLLDAFGPGGVLPGVGPCRDAWVASGIAYIALS